MIHAALYWTSPTIGKPMDRLINKKTHSIVGVALMNIIENSIDLYVDDFESIKSDIVAGIEEGFSEGLKEGVKEGFIGGVQESLKLGFQNVSKSDIKSLKEIHQNAFNGASKKSIRENIKKFIRRKYDSTIAPAFKQDMKEACDEMIEEIRDKDIHFDEGTGGHAKKLLSIANKKVAENIGDIDTKIRTKLSGDMIFEGVFDGIQEGLQENINEHMELCRKRFDAQVDKKTACAGV